MLHELCGGADAVVAGRIVAVESDTYVVAVDTVVVGEDLPRVVTVRQFEDWTCHGRWTAYSSGQRLLLFLCEDSRDPTIFRAMGAAAEGEMPFVGNDVVIEASQGYGLRGYDIHNHIACGAEITGTKLPYDDLAAAIVGARKALRVASKGIDWKVGPRETMSQVEAFAETSPIARHIFEEALSSSGWSGPIDPPDHVLEPSSLRGISASEEGFTGTTRFGPGRKPDRFGFESNTGFGSSLAFLGDLDGDGIGDLAVGAPSDSYLGHFHGAVWILFLDERGNVRSRTEIREELSGFPATMNSFAALGTAVAPLGDMNGDGIPDLLVSAPRWDGSAEHQGGVWALFLKRDGTIDHSREIGGLEAFRSAGVGEGFGLGASLANLGDLDGDGSLEIGLGQAPKFEAGDRRGRTILIASLEPNALVHEVRRLHDREDFGLDYSWLGGSMTRIGDVNGDGFVDIAIADTNDSDGGEVRGAVWVTMLGPALEIRGKTKISDWSGNFEGRLRDWSQFGMSLAGPGDIDGDGIPDLIVGSDGTAWTLFLRADGSVRKHLETAVGKAEGTSVSLGRSLCCAPHSDAASSLLGAGGSLKQGERTDCLVWWFELGTDGQLSSR